MTAPGGAPGLPTGTVLTLENLESRLQDLTATAMKGRALDWFPGLAGSTTGGNPASTLSPFGFLTDLWARFNSTIANADPNAVNSVEDLGPLFVEFVENLPVIGQFVQVVEAILGIYTGNDTTMLAIQEVFLPLRQLMLLVSGQPSGIPTVEQIVSGWQDLTDSIQEKVNEFADALLTAIAALIPFGLGTPVEQLGRALLLAINNGIDALQGQLVLTNQVADLSSKVNFNPALPAWLSYANGDQSVQFSTCLNSATVTPTVARWVFIRITNPAAKRTISVFCQKTAGVTGLFFDVYRIDPDGSATKVYTSTNEVTNASSVSLAPLTHTIPADMALLLSPGDLYAIQARMTGTGSVAFLSNNNTPDTTAGNLLPKRLGGQRDPSTTAAPATFTSGAMDAIYNAITAYMEFDIVQPLPPAITIFDDFGDVNLSTTQFTNYRTTVVTFFGQPIYLTVEDGCASYAGGTDGFQGAMTLSRLNMPANACRLGVQVKGLSTTTAWAGMNCASDWSSGVMLGVSSTGVTIASFTSFNDLGTVQASGNYSSPAGDGSWIYMQYDGTTNTYSVFDDGGTICTWPDTGNLIPHGTTYQYGIVKLVQASGIQSAKFDAIKLWDTADAIPAPSAPPSSGGGGTPVIGSTFPMTFGFVLAGQPAIGTFAAKPATAALTGSQAATLRAALQAATAIMSGTQSQSGVMAPIAAKATAAMQDALLTAGSMAATATSARAALAGPATNYEDLFDGAAGALDAVWTNRAGTRSLVVNGSGIATPNFDLGYAIASYGLPMGADNVRVSATMVGAASTGDVLLMTLRSNNGAQMVAYCYNGGSWRILFDPATYDNAANGFQQAATPGAVTWTTSDVIAFEASGTNYLITKNGTPVISWPDTGGTYAPYVNPSHREVSLGYYGQSGAAGSRGIDRWNAVDLAPDPPVTLSAVARAATAAMTGSAQPPDGTSAVFLLPALAALSGTQKQSGTVAGVLIPATAALAGSALSGAVVGTALPATLAATGGQAQAGAMGAVMLPATAAAAGGAASPNTLGSTMLPAVSALSGAQKQSGAINSALQLATAAMAGGHAQSGSISGVLQLATAAAAGGHTQAGSIVSSLQLATAILTGSETETGSITSALLLATAALSGGTVKVPASHNLNRVPVTRASTT